MIYIKKRTGLSILLSFLILHCTLAQQSITPILGDAKIFVEEFEKLGWEISHVGFNILTQTDNNEDSRRIFDSAYEYAIVAYGDENFDRIQINVYESKNNEWELVEKGQPLETNNYTSMLTFKPTETASYMMEVSTEGFVSGKTSGRFFIVVGSQYSAVVLTSNYREDLQYNTSNRKVKTKNKKYYSGSFTVSGGMMIHKHGSLTDEYTITENLTTDDDIENGLVLYSLENQYGNQYSVVISTTNGTLMLVRRSSKKDQILEGYRYYISIPN